MGFRLCPSLSSQGWQDLLPIEVCCRERVIKLVAASQPWC